ANTGKTKSTTLSWADQVQAADEARKAQANLEAREAAAGRALKRKAVSMSPGADTDTSEARASVRTKAPLALKPASVFARRVSARIQENHIQPAPEKQTVVTGVGRNPAAKELPAPKEAPASP
ncbi:unnamed protein product, partial [Tilletia caries]